MYDDEDRHARRVALARQQIADTLFNAEGSDTDINACARVLQMMILGLKLSHRNLELGCVRGRLVGCPELPKDLPERVHFWRDYFQTFPLEVMLAYHDAVESLLEDLGIRTAIIRIHSPQCEAPVRFDS